MEDHPKEQQVKTRDKTLWWILGAIVAIPSALLAILFVAGFVMALAGVRPPVIDPNIASHQWQKTQDMLSGGDKTSSPSSTPTQGASVSPSAAPTSVPGVSGFEESKEAGRQAKKLFESAADESSFWDGFNGR